jgi:SAM-dependent methyltransferase
MHDTAYKIGGLFLKAYAKASSRVVELGAMNVNGTLRDFCPLGATYIGLDAAAGLGVDIVVKPGDPLPLESETADIVIASSMLEHDIFFWETFLEMARIVKPGGTIYINTPSNGKYHRHPVDNWRFYPDSGKALESWAKRNNHALTLFESFIAERDADVWNDFVAVFVKGAPAQARAHGFLSAQIPCTNIWRHGEAKVLSEREFSEDMVLAEQLRSDITTLQQAPPPKPASPFDAFVRLFEWRPAGREKAKLIPHIRAAFPNIAAQLKNQAIDAKGLSTEIRRLLDFYVSAWPFDERYYLETYPDVAEAVRTGRLRSPLSHFRQVGYLEGRLPVEPSVDEEWYLTTYPDVATAIGKGAAKSAAHHFVSHGYREGRSPQKSQARPATPATPSRGD